jgi:hypothetical protein
LGTFNISLQIQDFFAAKILFHTTLDIITDPKQLPKNTPKLILNLFQMNRLLDDKQEMKKQMKKIHNKKKEGTVEKIFNLVRQGLKLGKL